MITQALRQAILSQDPTEQQREAIFAEELEFLLRAAPGSGKTWTSCRRFIWRGANWPYRAGGLALLSFTNVAIREFQAATAAIGRRDLLSDPNYVGTFDSFVERYVLAPFGHLLTGDLRRPRLFPGPRPGDWGNGKLKAWMDATERRRIPIPAWDIVPYPDNNKLRFKTTRVYGGKDLDRAAGACVRELLSLGYYTHAQRVFWACKLLFDRPHLARLLARRFPEIVVDEAQDCNAWLLVLLNFIREKGAKVTLIGDPDQCIFEFSMADATSLPNLKAKWSIPEKPLSQSFRCNNTIAAAARHVGGNPAFTGSGNAGCESRGAFIVKTGSPTFDDALEVFEALTKRARLALDASAVLCRAHSQLESIRGKVNYGKLQGKAKELATAAFLRDGRRDYRGAFQIVVRLVRDLAGDDPLWTELDETPDSPRAIAAALSMWRFMKDPERLAPVSQLGTQWIDRVRTGVTSLIKELGVTCNAKLGNQINKKGLTNEQMALPLFEARDAFPLIRQDTIHQVKGESIDAVLVIGSAKFWNAVVTAVQQNDNSEDRRLAYVAMTRARHVLLVALPEGHFVKHSSTWKAWGFKVVT
ncbi:MAG: ATP-dependent helicase [Phycisphaerae bacterium]|jgi:hypothetical protein